MNVTAWNEIASRFDPEPDSLGSYLARLRIKRGLSMPQLAAKAHVDQSYISRIESGRRSPSFDVTENIAAALKLTPDERNALLAKAGFLPDDPTSLVDPLAAQVHAALVAVKGTGMEATLRAAIGLMLDGAKSS